MKLKEMRFSEYYEKYLLIEADFLTEQLSYACSVDIDDCYILCSSTIATNGKLLFHVLSYGSSEEDCNKGIDINNMLGYFMYDELKDLNVKVIKPSLQALKKNAPFLTYHNALTDEELKLTRSCSILDEIRSFNYPDIVKAGIITPRGILEYDMRIEMLNGPFIEGRLVSHGAKLEEGLSDRMKLRAFPYLFNNHYRLLVVVAGDNLSSDVEEYYKELVLIGNQCGMGFSSGNLKS